MLKVCRRSSLVLFFVLLPFGLFANNVVAIRGTITYSGSFDEGIFYVWASTKNFLGYPALGPSVGALNNYWVVYSTNVIGSNVSFNYELLVYGGATYYISAFRDSNEPYIDAESSNIVLLKEPKGSYSTAVYVGNSDLNNINFTLNDPKFSKIFGEINYTGQKRENIAVALFLEDMIDDPIDMILISTPTSFPVNYEFANVEVGFSYSLIATMIKGFDVGVSSDSPYYIHGDTTSWPPSYLTPIVVQSTQPVRLDFTLIDGRNPFYYEVPDYNLNVRTTRSLNTIGEEYLYLNVDFYDNREVISQVKIKGYGIQDGDTYVELQKNQNDYSFLLNLQELSEDMSYTLLIERTDNTEEIKTFQVRFLDAINMVEPDPTKILSGAPSKIRIDNDYPADYFLRVYVYEGNNIIWSYSGNNIREVNYSGPQFNEGKYYLFRLVAYVNRVVDNISFSDYTSRDYWLSFSTYPSRLIIALPGEQVINSVGLYYGSRAPLYSLTPFEVRFFMLDDNNFVFDRIQTEQIDVIISDLYSSSVISSATVTLQNGAGRLLITMPTTGYFYITSISNIVGSAFALFEVIADTIPPRSFDLVSPQDNIWLKTNNINFSWQSSYDNSGYVFYRLYVNDEKVLEDLDSTSTQLFLPEGSFSWYVEAYDYTGLTTRSNSTYIVKIDTTPPNNFSILNTYNFINTNQLTVSWEEAVDNFGVNHYKLYVNGQIHIDNISNSSTTIDLNLPEAVYEIKIRAVDFAGNYTDTEIWNLKVDTTPPNIVFSYPQQNSKVNISISSITFKFSEQIDTSNLEVETNLPISTSTIILNEDTLVVELEDSLEFASTYYITLKKIKDFAQNEMSDYTLIFNTIERPKYKISGYVLDESSKGVVGVRVSVFKDSEKILETITKYDGKFEFIDLDGYLNYLMKFEKQGYVLNPTSTTIYLTSDSSLVVAAIYVIGEKPKEVYFVTDNNEVLKVELPSENDIKVIYQSKNRLIDTKKEPLILVFNPKSSPSEYLNKSFKIKLYRLDGTLVETYEKTPKNPEDLVFKLRTSKDLQAGVYIVTVEGPNIKNYKKVTISR